MQQRRLGATGLQVSRLGLGTMTWGGDTDEHEAREQLTAFVAAGGTLVDTAHVYADGASEELLGRLVSGTEAVVRRDEVVLATKAGLGTRRGGIVLDVSRGALLDHLDTSLRRLGTDHVDLWQVHGWAEDCPLEETLAALDHAVTTGRTRYVGVSNFGGWHTAYAAVHQRSAPGRAPIASVQNEYSLLQRAPEDEVLPAAEAFGLGFLPWSPLARGVLTGKYRTGTPSDSRGASEYAGFIEPYLDASSRRVVDAVARAADGLGWTPLEVALVWVRDQPGVTAPILGARTERQLTGALGVEDKTLPAELRAALDDVSGGA